MSRRTFAVVGIVDCLQPDRGGWELIDSHVMVPVSYRNLTPWKPDPPVIFYIEY